jgi:hypothetical protein
MGAGRNRTISSSANNFPRFRLDTVNECLWLRGGRQGGWYRIGKLRVICPRWITRQRGADTNRGEAWPHKQTGQPMCPYSITSHHLK